MRIYFTAAAVLIVLGSVIWYLERGAQEQPGDASTSSQEEKTAAQQSAQKQTQQAGSKPAGSAPVTTTQATEAAPSTPEPRMTYHNTNDTEIFVVLPKAGQTVTPGITVSGTARGYNWFYQGSFIAEVLAKNGDVLASIQVPAKGNANSTELVQFSSIIIVNSNYRGPATVVLRNDTPPGHPYSDRSVSIPVVIQ